MRRRRPWHDLRMSGLSAGELYVYYKVPGPQAGSARQEIQALQAALQRQWPGLESRLLRRDDIAADGTQTWMELYRAPLGLSPLLVEAILSQLADWPSARIGPRHTERFVPLDPD